MINIARIIFLNREENFSHLILNPLDVRIAYVQIKDEKITKKQKEAIKEAIKDIAYLNGVYFDGCEILSIFKNIDGMSLKKVEKITGNWDKRCKYVEVIKYDDETDEDIYFDEKLHSDSDFNFEIRSTDFGELQNPNAIFITELITDELICDENGYFERA